MHELTIVVDVDEGEAVVDPDLADFMQVAIQLRRGGADTEKGEERSGPRGGMGKASSE